MTFTDWILLGAFLIVVLSVSVVGIRRGARTFSTEPVDMDPRDFDPSTSVMLKTMGDNDQSAPSPECSIDTGDCASDGGD